MKIGIIGTGALGIAFTKVLEKEHDIIMWTKFSEEKKELIIHRENKKFFPGVNISDNIKLTNDLVDLSNTELIILAIPFVAVTDVLYDMKNWYKNQIICSLTKGIHDDDFKTTSEMVKDILGTEKVCAMSGPSFAIEIVNGNPIHLMLGSQDEQITKIICDLFENTNLKLEATKDVRGIEICGAIKNAIAIGAGVLHGLNASDSTKAAYLATGTKEMAYFLDMLSADKNTAYTYAGIGDLILTCTSEKSRNFTFGKMLGEGLTPTAAFEALGGKTVEGYKIIRALNEFINKSTGDSKLIHTLYDIVFNSASTKSIVY